MLPSLRLEKLDSDHGGDPALQGVDPGPAEHFHRLLPRLGARRARLFPATFVLIPVSQDFGQSIPNVAFAITLTLLMRPADGNPNYALTMASVEAIVFLAIIVLAALGHEKRGIEF